MNKVDLYCQEIENLIEVRYAKETQAYKRNVKITTTGVVVHSIGVAQPSVDVMYRRMNAEGDRWAVHALMNDTKIILTLPWDTRPWACGGGPRGTYNNNRFQFEICEPAGHTYDRGAMVGYDVAKNQAWFDRMYTLLIKFLVYLCAKYGLAVPQICDHAEAHKAGYASNHSDVGHWFPKHGKSMNTVREDVGKVLANSGGNMFFKIIEPGDATRITIERAQNGKSESIESVYKRTGAHLVITGAAFNQTTFAIDGAVTINNEVLATGRAGFGFAFQNGEWAWSYLNNVKYPYFMGAFGMLVKDGKVAIVNPHSGRTGSVALGMTADRKLLIHIVGNTDSGIMTTEELAQHMLQQRCVQAVRLDGGGSAQMFSKDQSITTTRALNTFICFWFKGQPITAPIPEASETFYNAICAYNFQPLDEHGRPESGRLIAAGDRCKIFKTLTPRFLVKIEYPTPRAATPTRIAYSKTTLPFRIPEKGV